MYVGGDQPRPNFDNEVEVQIMPGMWFKVRFIIFFKKGIFLIHIFWEIRF